MKKLVILFVLLSLLIVPSTNADEPSPHRMFMPAIPVNNGGCTPVAGDSPPATWVYVTDPSITVEITSPCDPLSHILSSEFYQDAAHPNGYWTGFGPIQRSRYQIVKVVMGRSRVWVSFTSTNRIPYSVEVSTP